MNIRIPRYNTSAILVFSLILVSSFVFLVAKFYQSALSEAISYHQQLQSEMAKSATTSIDLYFERLGDDLHFISQLSPDRLQTFLRSDRLSDQGIKAWFSTDPHFNIEGFWSDSSAQADEYESVLLRMAGEMRLGQIQSAYQIHFSPVYPKDMNDQDGPLEFMILYIPDKGFEGQTPGRCLGLVISFDWLMGHFVAPLKLGEDDFAWVMDHEGRLIYHPRHTEMLLYNIGDLQEECVECHSSFSIQEQMIKEGTGKAEYLIRGEPQKIMAYAPIQYGELKWVLAISTYSPSVVRDVLKNSISIFILSAAFLVLLVMAGISLYYLNLKRIRADEAQKNYAQVQRMQDRLDQAAKLASLGELIDSVAHEINTPTGIISVVADGMMLDANLEPEPRKELQVIKNQVQRIRVYTKRLLGYSKVMPFAPKLNDILDLTDECLFLLGPRVREKQVEIVNQLPEDCPKFSFDRPRLEQVIINLLNNAIDFVDKQGTIIIRLDSETEQAEQGIKQWNILRIQDDGPGILAADIPHIFEPFFSKRPSSNGTGLGLSISKSIVERHGGRLEAKSDPGEGATFSIYLQGEDT